MKTFLTGTKNELVKLVLKKKYIILLILSLLFCAGRVSMEALTSYIAKTNINISSNLSLEMGFFVFEILLPFVAFMGCTDLFATEIQEDTLKASLTKPITRFKLMTAKAAAVFVMCAVYAFLIFSVCCILQVFGGSFKAGYMLTSFMAYIINMVPAAVIICMAIFVNLLIKSPALAMFVNIAGYIFMKYMNIYGNKAGALFFTGYMQWHRIWMGTALPPSAIIMKSGIVIGTGIILFTVSYLLFDKKEF